MIATASEIRSRIEQLRLSLDGYSRQLARPEITPERKERLRSEVQFLKIEISTLEKLAQLARVESDRSRIEAIVRERLQETSARADATESVSAERKALIWALGEDELARKAYEWMRDHPNNPATDDYSLAETLIRVLRSGRTPEQRATAAHDLGRLRIAAAIPALHDALGDEPLVCELALQALRTFPEEELVEAGLTNEQVAKVKFSE